VEPAPPVGVEKDWRENNLEPGAEIDSFANVTYRYQYPAMPGLSVETPTIADPEVIRCLPRLFVKYSW